MPFEEFVLVVVLASAAFLFAVLIWGRYAPVRIAVENLPPFGGRLPGGAPDRSSLCKVGELVTALMLAKDGWKQLAPPSGEEPAGLFVRKLAGRNAFEVRIAATQCSPADDPKADYDAESMADDKVIERLESLKGAQSAAEPGLDDQAVDAVVQAIRRGSVHVTKHVYAHSLATGDTVIYAVGRNGQLIERPRVARVAGVPHQLMIHTLAAGLARWAAEGGLKPGDLTPAQL